MNIFVPTLTLAAGLFVGTFYGQEREYNRISLPAKKLVVKLDEIEKNPSYQTVWSIAQIHGFDYTGPDYKAELTRLRKALP